MHGFPIFVATRAFGLWPKDPATREKKNSGTESNRNQALFEAWASMQFALICSFQKWGGGLYLRALDEET